MFRLSATDIDIFRRLSFAARMPQLLHYAAFWRRCLRFRRFRPFDARFIFRMLSRRRHAALLALASGTYPRVDARRSFSSRQRRDRQPAYYHVHSPVISCAAESILTITPRPLQISRDFAMLDKADIERRYGTRASRVRFRDISYIFATAKATRPACSPSPPPINTSCEISFTCAAGHHRHQVEYRRDYHLDGHMVGRFIFTHYRPPPK